MSCFIMICQYGLMDYFNRVSFYYGYRENVFTTKFVIIAHTNGKDYFCHIQNH